LANLFLGKFSMGGVLWILRGLLVLAPFAVWGFMRGDAALQVNAARKAERIEQEAVCTARITYATQKREEDILGRIKVAREAARRATPTIETDAQLLALCQRSASCRDRTK